MPRNSNGTYTLPAGNPVVSGEVISTSWANPTMEDIGNELTNSLDRSGRGGMQAPFKNFDGTQSAPGITWGNEPTTGFWRNAAQDMRVTVGGQPRERWTAAGVDLWNGTIWSPVVTNATLETNLTAKGYAVKAANETITGTWSFDATLNARAVTLRLGSVLTLLNSDSTTSLTAGNDGALGWIRHPTSIAFQKEGFGSVLTVTDTLMTVSGAISAPGNGSFGGTLGVTGLATLSSGATLANTARFVSDGPAVIGTSFSTVAGVTRWLMGRDAGTNNLRFYRYDTAGAFLNTPLTLDSAGNVQVEGTFSATGVISQNGTAVALSSTTITGANTITGGGSLAANRTLQLVNDVGAPGSSWYYGTDASGVKGWFPLSGVVGVPEAPIDGQSYARQNASWVSLGSAGSQYVLKTGDTMTGQLIINMPEAVYSMNSSAAGTDEKRFAINVEQVGGVVVFRLPNDPWDAHDDFLRVTRSGYHPATMQYGSAWSPTSHYMIGRVNTGSGVDFPAFYGGYHLGVVGGATSEMGVFANNGYAYARAVMFAKDDGGSVGELGIDWTYSNAVSSFKFKRVGETVFQYEAGAVRLLSGAQLFLNNGANDNSASLYASGNDLVLNATSAVTTYIGGAPKTVLSTTYTDHYYGHGSRYLSADNSVAGIVRCDGGILIMQGDGALGFDVGGSRYADFSSGAINTYNGIPIRYYAPGNAGSLTVQKPAVNYSLIDENTGNPISICMAATPVAEIGQPGFRIYGARKLYLYGGDNAVATGIYNDANTGATGVLKVEGRGGILHWQDTGFYDSRIQVGTSDPATGGTPGTIFLVYE